MKIGIISTGNELLRGIITDTNAAWIASVFDENGYAVNRITVVGDDLDQLTRTLSDAYKRFDIVIVGGGLGPTDDDLTAQAAARAAGSRLVRNEVAAAQLESVLKRFNFPLSEANRELNLRQADLPEMCTVLENTNGTAPGFSLETERGRAYFFPGPPRELKPMFERYVIETLVGRAEDRHRAAFRCYGTGESDLQNRLRPIQEKFPDIVWSFRVTFPEISLTLTTSDKSTLDVATDEVRALLGRIIVAESEMSLPESLGRELAARKLTVATAESCTGGLIGHELTEVPGSSDYFLGGIVAYDNDIKIGLLGVDRKMIVDHGAVSEQVVKAMAAGVRQALGADFGLATSGIAGPGGGTSDKPVGLIHLAVAHPGGVKHVARTFGFFGRSQIKKISAWAVMRMALDILVEA